MLPQDHRLCIRGWQVTGNNLLRGVGRFMGNPQAKLILVKDLRGGALQLTWALCNLGLLAVLRRCKLLESVVEVVHDRIVKATCVLREVRLLGVRLLELLRGTALRIQLTWAVCHLGLLAFVCRCKLVLDVVEVVLDRIVHATWVLREVRLLSVLRLLKLLPGRALRIQLTWALCHLELLAVLCRCNLLLDGVEVVRIVKATWVLRQVRFLSVLGLLELLGGRALRIQLT